MSPKDIDRAAQELVSEKIKAGEIVQMTWAVTELIKSQGEIIGEGAGFYLLCAREHVYRVIKKAVKKYEGRQPNDGTQLMLDGYTHLLAAYTFEHEGVRQILPVGLVPTAQMREREREFRKQAGGLIAHADEIALYLANRSESSVGDSVAM